MTIPNVLNEEDSVLKDRSVVVEADYGKLSGGEASGGHAIARPPAGLSSIGDFGVVLGCRRAAIEVRVQVFRQANCCG